MLGLKVTHIGKGAPESSDQKWTKSKKYIP